MISEGSCIKIQLGSQKNSYFNCYNISQYYCWLDLCEQKTLRNIYIYIYIYIHTHHHFIFKCICFQASWTLLLQQSLIWGTVAFWSAFVCVAPGVCFIIIKHRASLLYFHCPPTLELFERLHRCNILTRPSAVFRHPSSPPRRGVILHFSFIILLCNHNWSSDERINL